VTTETHPAAAVGLVREELARRIEEALQVRDFERLENWALQWVQLEPRSALPFLWLGRATVALNKMARAAYAYGRVLDLDEGSEEARQFFGRHPSSLTPKSEKLIEKIERFVKDFERKKPHNNSLIDLTPDRRRELANLELALAERHESYQLFPWAEAAYARAFELHPEMKSAVGRARVLQRLDRRNDASKFLREQLHFSPKWKDARVLLARFLMESGNVADAQREWQIILSLDPQNREAMAFLKSRLTTK